MPNVLGPTFEAFVFDSRSQEIKYYKVQFFYRAFYYSKNCPTRGAEESTAFSVMPQSCCYYLNFRGLEYAQDWRRVKKTFGT